MYMCALGFEQAIHGFIVESLTLHYRGISVLKSTLKINRNIFVSIKISDETSLVTLKTSNIDLIA